MANLIASDRVEFDFPPLDDERRLRLAGRLALAAALASRCPPHRLDAQFVEELDELESEGSSLLLEALLDRIDRAREVALEGTHVPRSTRPPGRFLCFRPGHSLATGEAEIASRGFFDGLDRPPLAVWLDVFSRPMHRRSAVVEISVLCFVPEEDLARAAAGRAACRNGALHFLDEGSTNLARQVEALLGRVE